MLSPNTTRGTRPSLEDVFSHERRGLVEYCRKMVGEDAEDIVQIAFIKLWERESKIDFNKNVKGYIYSVAKRLCLDYFRKAKDLKQLPDDAVYLIEDELVNTLTIESAIDSLAPGKKKEIIGYVLEGYTLVEIAKKQSTSKQTVNSRLKKARSIVKKRLSTDQ